MRRLLYGIVCLGTLVACQREPGYKISGSVPGTPDGMKVYLYNWNTPVDSSVVKGGKFVLTGKVDVPTRYQLLIDLSPDKVESYEKDLRNCGRVCYRICRRGGGFRCVTGQCVQKVDLSFQKTILFF